MSEVTVTGDIVPADTTTKEWYKSRAMIGSIVAVAALILSNAGFEIDGVMQGEIADKFLEATAFAGSVFAMVGRVLATKTLK